MCRWWTNSQGGTGSPPCGGNHGLDYETMGILSWKVSGLVFLLILHVLQISSDIFRSSLSLATVAYCRQLGFLSCDQHDHSPNPSKAAVLWAFTPACLRMAWHRGCQPTSPRRCKFTDRSHGAPKWNIEFRHGDWEEHFGTTNPFWRDTNCQFSGVPLFFPRSLLICCFSPK